MHKAIRYIGSKQKLLPFLDENLFNKLHSGDTFFDGFVGSGIVSQYIAENYPNAIVSGSDLSTYSGILFNILNIGRFSTKVKESIIELMKEFEKETLIEGFVFQEFSAGGKPHGIKESRNFFHSEAGKTIDTFKCFLNQKLQKNIISIEQVKILLYFMLAYTCKMANTTSVFGAFLKSSPRYFPFNSDFVEKIINQLDQIQLLHSPACFYHGDIVANLKKIPKQNLIYLDPPYSTRRYESNYHILNYVVNLNFSPQEIKLESKTGQPIIMASNPFGMKKHTQTIFKEMILESVKKSDILGISYNTDGLITKEWMQSFCSEHNLKLDTRTLEYKRFKSNTEIIKTTQLEEILWLIQK
jgi:adenine-specific DNA-methyltransferase